MPIPTPPVKVDVVELKKLEDERLISIQQHPTFPYLIFNYTPECVYDKRWNHYTRMCRGLITKLDGEIVARPFEKFFNLSEHEEPESKLEPINWDQDFTCTEKMDGSLGIMYWGTDDLPYIATRGSFTSEQAIRATAILRKKYRWQDILYTRGLTFLFEIIYPENRIVVNYKDTEELVLLDIITNDSGNGSSYSGVLRYSQILGCPVTQDILIDPKILREKSDQRDNEEGYVVRFNDGTRIKIKFDEYMRLHRLLTQTTSRTVWEFLMMGMPMDAMLEKVPDEFYSWLKDKIAEINALHTSLEEQAKEIADAVMKESEEVNPQYRSRFIHEEIGKRTTDFRVAKVAYLITKGKYDSALSREWLWRKMRPAPSKPFHQDIDA